MEVFLPIKLKKLLLNTPNANMADRSVVARNELHESEASEAYVPVNSKTAHPPPPGNPRAFDPR